MKSSIIFKSIPVILFSHAALASDNLPSQPSNILSFDFMGKSCYVEKSSTNSSSIICDDNFTPSIVTYISSFNNSASEVWLLSSDNENTDECMASNLHIIAIDTSRTLVKALAPIKTCNLILDWEIKNEPHAVLTINSDWVFDGNSLIYKRRFIDALSSCQHLFEEALGGSDGYLDFSSAPDNYPDFYAIAVRMPQFYAHQTSLARWYNYDYQKKKILSENESAENLQPIDPILADGIEICKQHEKNGEYFKYYEVTADSKAYFNAKPDGDKLASKAFVIKGDRVIGWQNGEDNIFVEYTDTKGKATRGWLNITQLTQTDGILY